jgi:hypothetical protein
VFYLSEAPYTPKTHSPYDPYSPPLHAVYVYMYNYSHREGGGGVGELTREMVRGEIVHKAGRKYQRD